MDSENWYFQQINFDYPHHCIQTLELYDGASSKHYMQLVKPLQNSILWLHVREEDDVSWSHQNVNMF